MNIEMYVIEDIVAAKFNQPFVSDNNETAKRGIMNAARQDEGFANNPQDYRLFRVGSFDPSTGIIKAYDAPEFICNVTDLVKKGE